MTNEASIRKDPRIHAVPWRDLLALERREVVRELALSAPWGTASLVLAAYGWYVPALACSFMLFLTGLRQVHGAFHHALGLPRWANDCVVFALSVVMLGSMHAVWINHLRHHRHCLAEGDVEAMSARMTAWAAIATGPLFLVRLHRTALDHATRRQRLWIVAELTATVAVLWLAFRVAPVQPLRYHVTAMLAGQCLVSFFAVWSVHRECEREGVFARTIRGRILPLVSYDMFYHLEHHLFPAVPTCRLPQLAARLDQVAPELATKRVLGLRARQARLSRGACGDRPDVGMIPPRPT